MAEHEYARKTATREKHQRYADDLEQAARAELAALDVALLDDDAWRVARENLLRFFSLLQAFTEPEFDVRESDICSLSRDKITAS